MAEPNGAVDGFAPERTHKDALAEFQAGEEAFVWGLGSHSTQPWYLVEGRARDDRAHVKQDVVCPVPGCGAPLTTVSRSRARDGLRHLSREGGHSRESLDHSNGCAAVHDWLGTVHPQSTVRREEYTSPTGERRADVLITGLTGNRVAFEVQYSAITPEHWRVRHDSYRRQGIVDVWLWGHRGSNLRLGRDHIVDLTPAQQELVDSGLPLLYINPEQRTLAIGTWEHERLPDVLFGASESIPGWTKGPYAHLEVHRLADFHAHPTMGIESQRLRELHQARDGVARDNAERHARIAEQERKAAIERERELRQRRTTIAPRQARIRDLLGKVERWNRSDAFYEAVEYFDTSAWTRIESYRLPSGVDCLVQWQCVIYFDLIAGRTDRFTVRNAYDAIIARDVRMGQADAFKLIARYLHRLTDNDYLERVPSGGRYWAFKPTVLGAWW